MAISAERLNMLDVFDKVCSWAAAAYSEEDREVLDAISDLIVAEVSPPYSKADVEELVRAAKEAHGDLIWCSGSLDFSPEGKARVGWLKGPANTLVLLDSALSKFKVAKGEGV